MVVFNPVAGAQLYVFAPSAVNVVEFPEQIVADGGLTDTTGNGFTVVDKVVLQADGGKNFTKSLVADQITEFLPGTGVAIVPPAFSMPMVC